MLGIVVSTLRNHYETNKVKVVDRERMYEKGAIHNVVQEESEKSVGVFEGVERVGVVPLLQEGKPAH